MTAVSAATEARTARIPTARIELAKQARRPRTWTVFAVVAAIGTTVVGLVASSEGGQAQRIGDWGSVVPSSTGLALPLVALNALTLLTFPVVACLFAGDAVAGEAGWGSLRYLLGRPVARWRVVAAKVAVAAGLTVAAIVVSFAVALAVCVILYGWHPLAVVDLQHSSALRLAASSWSPASALAWSALALLVVMASSAAAFAFSFFLSTLTEYSFAAVAGGIGFTFTSRALDNIPGLQSLSPWLPVTEGGTTAWAGLFAHPVQSGPITHLAIVQVLYAGPLLLLAAYRFVRTDLN